ncbi:MAG: ABC transporter ATP-binding protein [Candidatus Symbiobacter sp.]|nr:ABC transporter ATP-binding protein [Candidatus Symbiobacter sp.]
METPPPVNLTRLHLKKITKHYPAVIANENIDLAVEAGEIHAILGENGAGKSTLMKIIYGVTKPTSGEIWWENQSVTIKNPAFARTLGIGMVFQHFSLFETLTAVENVALSIKGDYNLKTLAHRITELGEKYNLPITPAQPVHELSVGERQRLEIIRCLLQEPRLLILDEPTSVLTVQAVESLFVTLRQLAAEGCSILYISHKLDEIKNLCHKATILRAGRVTGQCDPQLETPHSLARMMIGRDLPVLHKKPAALVADAAIPRLKITHLSQRRENPFGTDLSDLNLAVAGGEILGIAGISGNGQQEFLQLISAELSLNPTLAQTKPAIAMMGQNVDNLGVTGRRQLGFGFIPEERLGRGAVPGMSLQDNLLLTAAREEKLLNHGFIRGKILAAKTDRIIKEYNVKCGGGLALAKSLSGGNLQKFIVGREILQKPKILLVAQPTWGVDVGAAGFIRQALLELRDQGCAILLISEELEEIFEICDKIAVLAKGRLSPIKPIADSSVAEIGLWMSGLWDKTDNRDNRDNREN